MMLKVFLAVFIASCISQINASSIRFPVDDDSEKSGGVGAEERYSDNQAASVVLQPNGVKRLPHFILPQVPSGQNPFGHVNPSGFAEGIILSQPSGRPPPMHTKLNTKMPEKMKTVQRIPYRVMAKPIMQHQTRKPLFAPKGPPPPKDTRKHPEANKYKTKHPHFNKEQEFHHLPKPESLGFTEKELTKHKGNKYYIKSPTFSHTDSTHPYRFLPTPHPSHDIHKHFDQNFHKDKQTSKEKHGYSGLSHFGQSPFPQQMNEHPVYQETNNKEDIQHSYHNNKHFVPVQEHMEDITYSPKKDTYQNNKKQTQYFSQNQKKPTHPTVDSLFDYISKWSESNKYDNSKYNAYKEFSELEEPSFEKEWLSGSEWVPIHAPAQSSLNENRVQSPFINNYDNTFLDRSQITNTFKNPSSTFTNTPSTFINNKSYPSAPSPFSTSFTNALAGQSSTMSNTFSRPEHSINSYDIRSQIFHKPEVVIGKRPKSADINNSHEVSAVFMVKQ